MIRTINFKDSKYKAGRFICGIFYWFAVVIMIIASILLFPAWINTGMPSTTGALLTILYEAWVILAGLFVMALSQVFKAHFDIADNSFR